jgi:alkylhydroperoxidase/carboxymuconolactone decarboxylase family protein YurZ
MWEPGILNHTDLALETGFTREQITEVVKVVSAVVGLANLDKAVRRKRTAPYLDAKRKKALNRVYKYFGRIPIVLRKIIVLEDLGWLSDLLAVTRPAYDDRDEIIQPKVRAYVALAAASVVGWEDGISLYPRVALRFGAKSVEIHDIIKSVFKTSVSNSMAAGFRSPCHIPTLEKYSTILSSYVEKGALSKRKADMLSTVST